MLVAAPLSCEIAGAVDQREDVDRPAADLVDESVAAQEQLSDRRLCEPGHDSPTKAELIERAGSVANTPHEGRGVGGGVLGDVVGGLLEVAPGRGGPDYVQP